MTKKFNETKTISLSPNFDNENQYHFTVKIPLKTYMDEVWDLTGVNSVGEEFYLEDLGKALMWLLLQLDHATKKIQSASLNPAYWRIHAPRKKRRMAALFAEVSAVHDVEPFSEVSIPAACGALPNTNVIHVEFSPKAK